MYALIDLMAKQLKTDPHFDAAIIAGFGCGEATILQEMTLFPVTGLLEASLFMALLYGKTFSIISGGDNWKPILEKQVKNARLSDRLASVRTVPLTGAEIVTEPERAYDIVAKLCERCATEDHASCVILGGAALAGFPEIIHDNVTIPLIDNLAITISTVLTMAKDIPVPQTNPRRQVSGSEGSINLSPELDAFLKNGF